ncbi:hypothetical protein LCGC14_2310850 [marine sediment metagenome]|uniref:Uncharacterized protein n=1 Tax=marine sediment metagenome TaxID=412755 RepID=A0A0F9CL75_9ZZZZ
MIIGAQVYWIMEIGTILSAEEASTADGLWNSLDIIDKGEFNRKADLFNELLEKEQKDASSEV